MFQAYRLLVLLSLCGFPMAVIAQAPKSLAPLPTLVTQYGCQSCHALESPRSAPSFQAIALRYRTHPHAHAVLAQKLRRGGAGAWGKLAMPPQVMVPDEALTPLIDWVLAQHPQPARDGNQKK